MESKIFIDFQDRKISGICKAKDFAKQISQLKMEVRK